MKQLLNFSVVVMFLLLGGCVNTSEQEHGEMISEIIATFGYPDMTKETTGIYSKFTNLSIDVSSVVEKYIPEGTSISMVYSILDHQGFKGFDSKPKINSNKIAAVYYIKSSREYDIAIIKETPHYRILIDLEFMDNKLTKISATHDRWLNSL